MQNVYENCVVLCKKNTFFSIVYSIKMEKKIEDVYCQNTINLGKFFLYNLSSKPQQSVKEAKSKQ